MFVARCFHRKVIKQVTLWRVSATNKSLCREFNCKQITLLRVQLQPIQPVERSARNKLQRSALRSQLVENSATNKPPYREFSCKKNHTVQSSARTSHPIKRSTRNKSPCRELSYNRSPCREFSYEQITL